MGRPDPYNRLWDWWEGNAWLVLLFGLPGAGSVLAHLAHWSPGELVALTAVLVAAALGGTGLLFWRRVRLAQADTALKQSMLQRGLTAEEMERLLTGPPEPPPPPPTDEQRLAELAACLHQSGVSEGVMEQVFSAVRAAELPTRLSLYHAILGLSGDAHDEAAEKEILAAVRGLSGNGSAGHGTRPAPEP